MIKITVEELDIIVQANIEGAVKEFQKLLPTIKKQLSGIQREFDKVNIKDIKANVNMSEATKKVQKAKQQIEKMLDFNGKKNIKGFSTESQKLGGNYQELIKSATASNLKYNKKEQLNTQELDEAKTKVKVLTEEQKGLSKEIEKFSKLLDNYKRRFD